MDTAGPFSAVSLKQLLKAPEVGEAGETTCRTLPCSVSAGTAEDLERHGRPCRHYWLHLQNQSMGVNHDWIPPCSRESHPRSAMPTFSPPPPPPPPPPPLPCTNLTFTVQFLPILVTINRAAPASIFSLPLHPPPPSVKVCACCVYCHDEVVHQCSVLSGDPAGPPHGT